jgi:Family of unknown function (DUF6491)
MIRGLSTSLRAIAGLLPLVSAAAVLGQDGEEGAFDRTPEDCIIVSRIDETDAIDDQNIIFRMRDDEVYRNTLPRKCPGLERENRIAYESRGSRLCKIDTITVLEDIGVGFRPGFTCRLGEFVPLSPDEIEELEFREDGEAGQSAIETSEIEIERDDESAETDDAPAAADEGEQLPAESSTDEPSESEN